MAKMKAGQISMKMNKCKSSQPNMSRSAAIIQLCHQSIQLENHIKVLACTASLAV